MNIEIAIPLNTPQLERGSLLEKLASDFVKTQGFEVDHNVRMTGSELDLLCKHTITKKVVYVECKAYRDTTISANILNQLLGTIISKDFQEGWLISTGALGREATGFQVEWENKPTEQAQKLTIYTPDRIIDTFIKARIIKPPPQDLAARMVDEELLGDWTLLISSYGKHWIVTCLAGGVPESVLVFSAESGKLVEEQKLLKNISNTDTSLRELDFDFVFKLKGKIEHIEPERVIEIQHGDSWSDYRPARPQDFVGRQESQKKVIRFLESVIQGDTRTRVLAITGSSGMGKSSLIAKLRERLQNQRYKKKYFIFAVDVRAAKSSSYIYSALLEGFRKASQQGFGSIDSENLKITNFSEPLESSSIKNYLKSLEKKNQVVCVFYDQFEELYSKSNLFNVFEIAQRLFLSVTSSKSNLVLGFAWKSDSTVQQNHPAYFLWHGLSNYRYEIKLERFRREEASAAITLFEKVLGEKLNSSLKRQLMENTQGYPWLLKKLCIHVYDQIQVGMSQAELIDKALDIGTLFEKDLQKLTQAEKVCLKLIAESAPADTYEILEISGNDVLTALIDKRLIIRSGDKLNVYWDIFKEYVISEKVPFIPLTYLPSYQSLNTVLMVAKQLSKNKQTSYEKLSKSSNLNKSTVGNVIHDLIMFGVATGEHSKAKLDDRVESSDVESILKRLRFTISHHALTMRLRKLEKGTILAQSEMIDLLKEINPTAQHGQKTWEAYSDRISQWLAATGYLSASKGGYKVDDIGTINSNLANISVGYYLEEHIFIGDAPPNKTVQALDWLLENPKKSWSDFYDEGSRNAALALRNLGIITNRNGIYILADDYKNDKDALKIVWEAALKHETLQKSKEYLKKHPNCKGISIGIFLKTEYERNWTSASVNRVGNSIKQWTRWLLLGETSKEIPAPLGRRDNISSSGNQGQRELFE